MVWNYPDISLEELMKFTKGLVDILILASGYQSSGLFANWDSHNIKKALLWGSFFENVIRMMSSSDVYQDSLREFDAALHEMTSNPCFPQGLADLSCSTLSQARNYVLAHLFRSLSVRDSHLRAFLTAIIEIDLDKLSESEQNCLPSYLNKLKLQNASFKSRLENRDLMKDLPIPSGDISLTMNIGKSSSHDSTMFTVQELYKRQSAVSCISMIETGLDILSNSIQCNNLSESDICLFKGQLNCDRTPASMGNVEQFIDVITWDHWKAKNLLYFVDMRTVRLVSGASMIFSAARTQWSQVFERLNTSADCQEDDFHETIEVMLLGCSVSRWNSLIEYFMSVSYNTITISTLCGDVCNLLSGQSYYGNEDASNSKENAILEYLYQLLGSQLHPLWKLPPALVAAAIPFWSPLFKMYLNEIETQFKGDSSAMRCCSCIQDGKDHSDCQLIERIWCLYVFHVCGSHILYNSSSAQ